MTPNTSSGPTPPEDKRPETPSNEDSERLPQPSTQRGRPLVGEELIDPANICALHGNGMLNSAMTAYKILLTKIARQQCGARLDKDQLRHLRKLLDLDNYSAISLIWKESARIRDAELRRANLSRSFGDRPLTRHALARAMQKGDGVQREAALPAAKAKAAGGHEDRRRRGRTVKTEAQIAAEKEAKRVDNRYAQRANRLADAALYFGLIEPDEDCSEEERHNCKPLRATGLLHDLMKAVGVGVTDAIAREMEGPADHGAGAGPDRDSGGGGDCDDDERDSEGDDPAGTRS